MHTTVNMDGSDLVLVLCRLYFAHYLLCSPICHISSEAPNVKCKCHMVKAVRLYFAHYLLCSPICHISSEAPNVKCKCHMVKAVRVHSLPPPPPPTPQRRTTVAELGSIVQVLNFSPYKDSMGGSVV